jgi:hypothetical protein
MKRVFAIILSLLFVVTFSFAVVGCKKAEEQKPEPAKTEAPAPAPAAPAAPGAAPVTPAAPGAAPAAPAPAAPAAK